MRTFRTRRCARQIATVAAVAMLTTACQIRSETGAIVEADETGELRMVMAMDEEMRQLMQDLDESEEPTDLFADLRADAYEQYPDATVTDYVDGEFEGLEFRVPFTSLAELNENMRPTADEDDESSLTGFSVTRTGSRFTFAAETADLGNDDSLPEPLVVAHISMTLPGELVSHNADTVDGTTLTWDVTDGPRTLSAVSQLPLVAGMHDVAGTTHADSIAWVADAGITGGYPDGTFRPNEQVTRAQMATFLARALELPAGSDGFADVSGTHAASVAAVAGAGITGGYPDGTFRPSEVVTRAQMATFLARALDLPSGSGGFADVSGTHAASVAAVAEAGITGGYPDGTFRPNAPVTRGQMATFLARALDTER